ncbi:glycosyl transferase family 90-domain-containing protein [Mycena metata]|uniref:Glycosyl transferase family 90-domain-containing protein n=1 Tax=Mycena metata TaxID=1033252 RepID=A0AAD7HIM1_9AGAR|nr:glycosyl transferase family 90-domain-containing protein [Mycena metata]
MTPPIYTVLRRRSLRRPASILLVVCLVLFYFRGGVFDAQHSTRVAFRLAAGRRTVTETATVWATRTVTRSALPIPTEKPKAKASWLKKDSSKKSEQPPLGQHIYHPNGLLYVDPSGAHPIPELIARAEARWARKLASASTSLRQAAAEYTRRYDRLPPKGFDLWWGYAMANNVQLPDEYDQIDRDLAPFYGVDPVEVWRVQREWEAHADSYTIGKDSVKEGLAMLNFTLPADERVRFELASGGFQLIELLREVEGALPPFRAVFSPHDNPNLVLDYQLRQQALDAVKKGIYIDPAHPPPQTHGWRAACPPLTRTQLDALPPPFDEGNPNEGVPSVPGGEDGPKTFIHHHLPAMNPCQHPAHLRAHGAYIAHGHGPSPHSALIPQFSYSVTPLHADIRVAMPLNWVSDDFPREGQPPPVGLSWAQRTDARLQWRGSNTVIWHAADGRWKEAHRIRLAALGAVMGSANVSVLDSGAGDDTLGLELASLSFDLHDAQFAADAARQRPEWIDVLDPDAQPALSGDEADEFAGTDEIWGFESKQRVEKNVFRAQEKKPVGTPPHDLQTAARYKYVLDVDGNGWSSRFKRLMNSGSLIFKVSAYPEWFTDRLAPWVHYVPIQNSYTDLLDTLLFFRAHDERGARIAAAGCEWSRRFWREEDLVAYNFRLFLEYARVMSADRAAMSFVMWENERDRGRRGARAGIEGKVGDEEH